MSLLKTHITHTQIYTTKKLSTKKAADSVWMTRQTDRLRDRPSRQTDRHAYWLYEKLESMASTHTHTPAHTWVFRKWQKVLSVHVLLTLKCAAPAAGHDDERTPRSGFHFYAVTLVDPLTVSNPSTQPPTAPYFDAIKKLCRQTKQSKKKMWNRKKNSLMGCERWSAERIEGQKIGRYRGNTQCDKSRDGSSASSINRTGLHIYSYAFFSSRRRLCSWRWFPINANIFTP